MGEIWEEVLGSDPVYDRLDQIERSFIFGLAFSRPASVKTVLGAMEALVRPLMEWVPFGKHAILRWNGPEGPSYAKVEVLNDSLDSLSSLPETVEQVSIGVPRRLICVVDSPDWPGLKIPVVREPWWVSMGVLGWGSLPVRITGHVEQPDWSRRQYLAERIRAGVWEAAVGGGLLAGYVSCDWPTSDVAPYESAVGADGTTDALVDAVCGPHWGNLLTDRHLDLVGGREAVEATDGVEIRKVGDWWWVQLVEEYPKGDIETLRIMKQLLGPILPTGKSTVDEYNAKYSHLAFGADYLV